MFFWGWKYRMGRPYTWRTRTETYVDILFLKIGRKTCSLRPRRSHLVKLFRIQPCCYCFFFLFSYQRYNFQIFSDGRYSLATVPFVRPLSLPVVTKHWVFNIFRSIFFFYCSIETLWWLHILWLVLKSIWIESFRGVMIRVVGLCTGKPGSMSECRMFFLS